jgi:hypothetical protein
MSIKNLTLDEIYEIEAENPPLVGNRTAVFLEPDERSETTSTAPEATPRPCKTVKRAMQRRGERSITPTNTRPNLTNLPAPTPHDLASRPDAVVWAPILAKVKGATRAEVALVVAFMEFRDAGLSGWAKLIGKSPRSVFRYMKSERWQLLLRLYAQQRKDLGRVEYQHVLHLITSFQRRKVEKGHEADVDALSLLGKFYGDLGPETKVDLKVEATVVSAGDLVLKALASDEKLANPELLGNTREKGE